MNQVLLSHLCILVMSIFSTMVLFLICVRWDQNFNYLSYEASTHAKRLKGGMTKNNQSLVLSMDDHKEGLLFDKLLKLQITSLLRGELKQRARAMREGEVKQRWIPLRFAEWWEKHGWARMMIEVFVKPWERRTKERRNSQIPCNKVELLIPWN